MHKSFQDAHIVCPGYFTSLAGPRNNHTVCSRLLLVSAAYSGLQVVTKFQPSEV
uniref:Uncharacterized protein n=1 Tax=Arundo donax TaxID=35708 RepID=A0A0A9BEQ7_ARUDO